ncbi:hypothetical protein [Paenibacillus albidus]|nr:hypothetical protein [Paenibacillus albidus]
MKKMTAGFIAGALLMVSAQALGSSSSLVGKKIQAEYTLTVYGKKLADSAIVIDGKSYAPVRAIGELAGYNVSVAGRNISLNEKSTVSPGKSADKGGNAVIAPVPVFTPESGSTVTRTKINAIDNKIDTVVDSILTTSSALKADPDNTDLKSKLNQYKEEYAELLEQKEAELEK